MPTNPAIFLDRDGTLMREVHYCSDPARVEILPGVTEGLSALCAAGFRLVIITNQSGIGRGYFTEADFWKVQEELLRQIAVPIDATYFSPAAPGIDDPRRKPAPGMVLEAARDLELDLAASWFIGDKAIDVECGHNAGTRSILVLTGYGAGEKAISIQAEAVVPGVKEAADFILSSRTTI